MIDFGRALVDPHNRGIGLDLVVFLLNLLLVHALAAPARNLAHAAQEDPFAKLAVGLFFAGLLLLQPVGPALKRWSFHQRHSFETTSFVGCFLFWFMFVYFVMMLAISATACVLIAGVFFKHSGGESVAVTAMLVGLAWRIISVAVVYRYFVPPKKTPSWAFLTTPAAAHLGDVSMYLNVIGLQILWACVTASAAFREIVTGTPLGRPGSFTDILGRFIAIGALALLVYIPGRIFYLVEDRHRALTWPTMLLANLPMIIGVAMAAPVGR